MARKLLILLGALALALALPAAAHAARFCVKAAECEGLRFEALQDALNAAGTPDWPGADQVEVGPGEYVGPFTAGAANPVEIVGVGQGETVLTAAGDADPVVSLAAPASALRRVRVRLGTGVGVRLTGGTEPSVLENMTVELSGTGTGVQVSAGTSPATAALRHVTLAGNGTGTGLAVTASEASAASATVSSSVITRFAVAIRATNGTCPTEPCPAATVTTDYSAYDATPPANVPATNGPIEDEPRLGPDLRPMHDSPLVDAANPAPGGETDASGAPRTIDGNGDGQVRSDIGALEYQRRAPVISGAAAVPAKALAGVPIEFTATASDADDEVVSAVWTFSDGATATGLEVTHAFAAPGPASAELRVTDAAGEAATTSVAVTIDRVPVNAEPPAAGPPAAGPPATVTRRSVIARVLPAAVELRAVARRDRRAPYRFRLRGRVELPAGIATAGCTGGVVRLAIRAGKRRTTRSVQLASDCRFRLTLKLRGKRARRVVVLPRFGGTPALAPLDGAKLRLRAG